MELIPKQLVLSRARTTFNSWISPTSCLSRRPYLNRSLSLTRFPESIRIPCSYRRPQYKQARIIKRNDSWVDPVESVATFRSNMGRWYAVLDVEQAPSYEDPNDGPSDRGIESASDGGGEIPTPDDGQRWAAVKKKLGGITSNAERKSQGLQRIKYSLGVDVGDCRTGVAISMKGYAPRPLSVVHLKGDKLVHELLRIASKEGADEFIVGLPVSFDGTENLQTNKTRSFTGRLATQAALRGWRVFLMDEYGSSQDGLHYMLESGVKRRARKEMLDAYAAMVLLSSYYNSEGARVKLIVPKGLSCQEHLCLGDNSVTDDDDDDCYDYYDQK